MVRRFSFKSMDVKLSSHIDVTGYWIAVSLVDDNRRDPDWVRMVMKANGHGDIDIVAARLWLAANPKLKCGCEQCGSKTNVF